ncbi:hypothetical protein TIFTF001_028685 [Ficus carica]|uniref:Uncharacterized protein n=1 Tax=Ficus carica TaxID=3494 RepID=A0AA88DQC8_FICCA|nr:hypothetical protein TIFTF001_028685 [Ficus carica]
MAPTITGNGGQIPKKKKKEPQILVFSAAVRDCSGIVHTASSCKLLKEKTQSSSMAWRSVSSTSSFVGIRRFQTSKASPLRRERAVEPLRREPPSLLAASLRDPSC